MCFVVNNIKRNAHSCFHFVETSRVGQGMKYLGAKLHHIGTKVLDFVLPKNPVTNRREFKFIPTFVENYMGEMNYDRLCPRYKICTDKAVNENVKAVFDKVVSHCERKLAYEIRVMDDSKTVNAFCLPGGKVVITTALLEKIKERLDVDKDECQNVSFDDTLAAVLGHEIVHAAAGHSSRRMQLGCFIYMVGKVVCYVLPRLIFKGKAANTTQKEQEQKIKNTSTCLGFLWNISSYLFKQHYSRSNEIEADKYGMKYAALANYNPNGAVRLQHLFLTMKGKKDGAKKTLLEKGSDMLSTHPSSQERLNLNRETVKSIQNRGIQATFA